MCLSMDPVFAALGALDLLAAYLLFSPFSDAAVLYLMMYVLAKGGFFFLTSITSKSANPFFVLLCVADIVTGVSLGAVALGYSAVPAVASFIAAFRLVALLKGLYGLGVSLFG